VLLLATAFVLGTRVVPSLAETRLGFWLLLGSEALSGLALKSQALRERLLVPVGKRSGLVAASVADVDAEL
jgi:hypothetical protein